MTDFFDSGTTDWMETNLIATTDPFYFSFFFFGVWCRKGIGGSLIVIIAEGWSDLSIWHSRAQYHIFLGSAQNHHRESRFMWDWYTLDYSQSVCWPCRRFLSISYLSGFNHTLHLYDKFRPFIPRKTGVLQLLKSSSRSFRCHMSIACPCFLTFFLKCRVQGGFKLFDY